VASSVSCWEEKEGALLLGLHLLLSVGGREGGRENEKRKSYRNDGGDLSLMLTMSNEYVFAFQVRDLELMTTRRSKRRTTKWLRRTEVEMKVRT
jgi:hypothetical protein